MILFKQSADLSKYFLSHNIAPAQIGFVPTMGALHQGHLSLLRESIAHNAVTVCSIFVNPTQFNDPEDFKKYPVTIEADIEALETSGTGILFMPSVADIYPSGTDNLAPVNLGQLEQLLEGKFRPGHFQGVSQVMSRLLQMVHPGNLYMGQKDYQQCMVVKRLIELLRLDTQLHTIPTLRESDGLAMSSRNVRLQTAARAKAPAISQSLRYLRDHLQVGALYQLRANALDALTAQGFRVDYLEIADTETLEPVMSWNGEQSLVALTAAYLDDVRLIDNMVITP